MWKKSDGEKMRLIDADVLIHDALENPNEIICMDNHTTYYAFLDFIGKQKVLLRHYHADEFVIAPCPKCGSAEVVIDIAKRKIGSTKIYYGKISCLSCGEIYGVYAPRVQDVYRHWNNDFVKLWKEANEEYKQVGEEDETD